MINNYNIESKSKFKCIEIVLKLGELFIGPWKVHYDKLINKF